MNFGDSRLPDRFWQKVTVAPSGCWEWTGAKADGRGQIQWKCEDGIRRRVSVYRLTFQIKNGTIDPALTIDHLCENPSCCNPAHLEQVTAVENSKRFAANHPVTHCPRGHAKTDDNVYASSGNRCRQCHAVAMRTYNDRKPRKPPRVRLVDVSGVIRTARTSVGLRLQDLATALGIKHNTLSTWERGIRPIATEALPSLEATIGVRAESLAAS